MPAFDNVKVPTVIPLVVNVTLFVTVMVVAVSLFVRVTVIVFGMEIMFHVIPSVAKVVDACKKKVEPVVTTVPAV